MTTRSSAGLVAGGRVRRPVCLRVGGGARCGGRLSLPGLLALPYGEPLLGVDGGLVDELFQLRSIEVRYYPTAIRAEHRRSDAAATLCCSTDPVPPTAALDT